MQENTKSPPLLIALIPIFFLIIMLAYNVIVYGDDSLSGSNQLALLLAGGIAAVLGLKYKFTWPQMLAGITKSISSVMPSIFILLMIGALAGTWLLSGIVPGMIYYGLQILNPTIFLVATCIVTALVSLATGSSWSTIATIGIALLGIGQALGIPEAAIGGAIISGAYFGDKISPLSDTTNLAPAMAGTDLFTHIKYMMYTTVPSFVITLILFLIIGFSYTSENAVDVQTILNTLEASFNINWSLFLVPAIVIFLILKKVPPIPTLLIGSILGGIYAVIFQPQIIEQIASGYSSYFRASYVAVVNAMTTDISITTNNEMINNLLSASGMYGMLNTIWLILCAMVFGGVMETTGFLHIISTNVLKMAKSTFGLFAATVGTCLGFNLTASDQYLAIVVPGKMYAEAYRKKGLAPENLSRTLEDSGTVTSVLIPWNTCGATQSAVLGVATLVYLPFCFFNIISPIMTLIFAFFKIKIRPLAKD
ncbi:MAG: NhaC family Na+:H+ antiporter [Flavobacteriales bacterium]|jgi:NhaC family Na+:H+ antiporter